ncbi:MAG TPA: hypothetical protein DCY07_00400 [Rhodospirillaceae bacterium]|nr:hypothetical protein [Rhodospirillaceae bacterium]
MKNFTVREYVPQDNEADKDAYLPAYLGIWNDPENLKYLSFTIRPFDESLVRGWLENHKERGVRYLCAENEDNKILGIVAIITSPTDGFEITGMGVRSDSKRLGIGHKLIEKAIDMAIKLNYKAIDVAVFADNKAMLTLCLSLDFIPREMGFNKRADGADIVHLKKYL